MTKEAADDQKSVAQPTEQQISVTAHVPDPIIEAARERYEESKDYDSEGLPYDLPHERPFEEYLRDFVLEKVDVQLEFPAGVTETEA